MSDPNESNPFRDWLDADGNLVMQEAPPWRDFKDAYADKGDVIPWAPESWDKKALDRQRGIAVRHSFRDKRWEVEVIRAALVLRRPILVTGKPGVGKSSLAYVAAHFLNLGPVLRWDINSRSTLADAVYRYDAIARLQAVTILEKMAAGRIDASDGEAVTSPETDIGHFLKLGPVGTALLPRKRPRVLLIDEIDKSDLDLPDDLLHVLEDGEYVIPELDRLGAGHVARVRTADGGEERATLTGGKLQCYEFPLIFLTSNGERDFSSAFLRRCLHLKIGRPSLQDLQKIVESQLRGRKIDRRKLGRMARDLRKRLPTEELTTDQFLNTFFAVSYHDFRYSGDPENPGIERSTLVNVEQSPVPPDDEVDSETAD